MAAREAGILALLTSFPRDGCSSYDSSSDDESEARACAYMLEKLFPPPTKRPKIVGYIEDVVHEYSDEEFRRNFRLPRSACYDLISDFEESSFYPDSFSRGGIPQKTAEEHILSFLWFAGNKCCIRDVAGRFNLSEGGFHNMKERVVNYLLSIAPSVIKFPADLDSLASDFEEVSGIPGVIGCIDGTYINFRCPDEKIPATYVNRHEALSLTLQGVCDDKRRFIDAFTGVSSRIHDARVFDLSDLSERLPTLCRRGKFHILGDAAYPSREYLVTPFKDYGKMTREQRDFNRDFSATRVTIENSFQVLKRRFMQLSYLEFAEVDTASKFIMSCCVLHNLCIQSGDIEIEGVEATSDRLPDDDDTIEETRPVLRSRGIAKRERLCDYVNRP
uniref:Putative nuclease harbi1 isoform x1 n=2 Tax=Ixodes ricinus TaxID=34613 RepID=A0A6B0VBN9_IXORI